MAVGILTIQNNKFHVAIDTAQKVILVGNPKKNTTVADLDSASYFKLVKTYSLYKSASEKTLKLEYVENPTLKSLEINKP